MAKSKPVKKPVKKSVQKSASKTAAKPAAKSSKPALKAARKTAAKLSGKSASKMSSKPAMKPTAKAAAKSAPKSAPKSALKTAAKATAKSKPGKLSPNPTLKNPAKFAVTPKDRTKAGNSTATSAQKSAPAKATATAKPASKATAKGNLDGIFSPLDDRVIVEEVKNDRRTAGGLYIPDSVDAQEGPSTGKVIAVGRGLYTKKGRLQPLDVKLGDTVLFETYMGQPLEISGREVFVLREGSLLAIVND